MWLIQLWCYRSLASSHPCIDGVIIIFSFPVEALSRSELSKAELELEINKIKTEEASLRDALLKMQALNEGLGQDKIELNKIIMQVCSLRNASI